jgi:hypothetical protein
VAIDGVPVPADANIVSGILAGAGDTIAMEIIRANQPRKLSLTRKAGKSAFHDMAAPILETAP